MKEIKFRAWDGKDIIIWKNLQEINLQELSLGVICEDIDKQIKIIPMQFTGLQDRNGKDIYEGDIVKCKALITSNLSVHGPQKVDSEWVGEVKMIDGCFMCRYYLWEIEDREVIGNIYQNKDLLKND